MRTHFYIPWWKNKREKEKKIIKRVWVNREGAVLQTLKFSLLKIEFFIQGTFWCGISDALFLTWS